MNDISYLELAILQDMFEKETIARGITFQTPDEGVGAFSDFCEQYATNPFQDPHITIAEGVTCQKEVCEIDWAKVYQ